MPSFTLPLKDVLELEKGNIGLDQYTIFNEAYREGLNAKIIDHYWNQEIGTENISMFRFAMRRKMNEIMPYYNEQYKISLLAAGVDPMSTMKIKSISSSEMNGTGAETSSSTSESDSKARAIGSDFPQTMLSENGDYASNGQDSISNATATGGANSTQDSSQTASSESITEGFQGVASSLIMAARAAVVNIDMDIINELRELFMLIWSTPEPYSESRSYYGLY